VRVKAGLEMECMESSVPRADQRRARVCLALLWYLEPQRVRVTIRRCMATEAGKHRHPAGRRLSARPFGCTGSGLRLQGALKLANWFLAGPVMRRPGSL